MARDHHQFDPQYWLNSGLVNSQSEVDAVFTAAEACLQDESQRLDPAGAAVALFNAQAQLGEFVQRALGGAEYVWPQLPSAKSWIDRRNEARVQADLPPLPREDISSTSASISVAGTSSIASVAGSSRVTRRSAAAAAEAAASGSAAPRSRSSSSSFELQASHCPKKGGKPVNLATAKRD